MKQQGIKRSNINSSKLDDEERMDLLIDVNDQIIEKIVRFIFKLVYTKRWSDNFNVLKQIKKKNTHNRAFNWTKYKACAKKPRPKSKSVVQVICKPRLVTYQQAGITTSAWFLISNQMNR